MYIVEVRNHEWYDYYGMDSSCGLPLMFSGGNEKPLKDMDIISKNPKGFISPTTAEKAMETMWGNSQNYVIREI